MQVQVDDIYASLGKRHLCRSKVICSYAGLGKRHLFMSKVKFIYAGLGKWHLCTSKVSGTNAVIPSSPQVDGKVRQNISIAYYEVPYQAEGRKDSSRADYKPNVCSGVKSCRMRG